MINALVDLLGRYYANNELGHAETIARSMLAAVPDDLVSLQFIGLVHYRSGQVVEAARIFDRAFSQQKRPGVRGKKPQENRLTSAEYASTACYQAATRLNPDLALAWHDLGTSLLELGKFWQGIRAFRSALLAQPDYPAAALAMARAALQVNDLNTAHEGFSLLSKLQPERRCGFVGLAIVHRRRGEKDLVRSALTEARKRQPPRDSVSGFAA